jgi:hypothetical protein
MEELESDLIYLGELYTLTDYEQQTAILALAEESSGLSVSELTDLYYTAAMKQSSKQVLKEVLIDGLKQASIEARKGGLN